MKRVKKYYTSARIVDLQEPTDSRCGDPVSRGVREREKERVSGHGER